MSGSQRSSADLDPRRRRILYRAWHRGMREMDLIMGKFADAEILTLSEDDMVAFEKLIDAQDQDIFSWISDTAPVDPEYDTPLFARMKAFHFEGRGLPE